MAPREAPGRAALLALVLALFWHVGCDGVLDSRVHFDKCGVCGGDNTSCHIISGIFTRRSLPYGYNKVATIPRGACNINITEIMPNRNFLALKLTRGQQYLINGDWVVGASKQYSAAGTTFRYYRPLPGQLHQKGQKEYIIGTGPTNDSIDIMLLKQQENHGIMYEYTIPMSPSPAASKATKPANQRHRKSNWTKPEVKVKGPLALTGEAGEAAVPRVPASDARQRPADEAERPSPSQKGDFRPELSARYRHQEALFADYLGAVPYQQQRRRVTGGTLEVTPRPAQPNAHFNKASGHRIRHRGRHGTRRNRKLPAPVKQFDYQAQKLGSAPSSVSSPHQGALQASVGSQGSVYRYPPLVPGAVPQRPVVVPQRPGVVPQRPGVVPARLVPIPQPASQRRPGVGGTYQPPSKLRPYGAPSYPHVIPATRRQLPPPGAAYPPPTSQLFPQGPALVGTQRHRYDMVYYPQGGATQQQAGAKWALNDQIALSLPGTPRYLLQNQLGGVDAGSDFTWRISGFSECSRTCGGGTQTTVIVCVKGASQAVVTDENCDNALKPESQAVSCNARLCPPAWEPTPWSECSTSCGRGTQTRDAECRQMVALRDVRPVSAALCRDLPKPDTVRMCNENKPCVRWRVAEWSKCSADCGRGQRTREVVCVNSEDRPIAENKCPETRPLSLRLCDMGSCAKTWFYTEWADQCSTSCGEGVYIRKLHCSADAARCAAIRRPKEMKACQNRLPCGGQWFVGPWHKCSVTCGHGVTRRDVICMKRLGRMMPVGEENCLVNEKPEMDRPCENPTCGPRWYKTDWSKCTQTCGTGYQQRDVKCLDDAQRTTTRCAETDKQDVWRTCNTLPCRPEVSQAATGEATCQDEYNNCRLVVQARLCHYAYYQKACCLSCTLGNHGDEQTPHDVTTPAAHDFTEKKANKQREVTSRGRRRQT